MEIALLVETNTSSSDLRAASSSKGHQRIHVRCTLNVYNLWKPILSLFYQAMRNAPLVSGDGDAEMMMMTKTKTIITPDLLVSPIPLNERV